MTARALMFMGTGSDVGKSLIVAGLCRALVNRGIKVSPFKPQNMSNNAAVTADGGEIGRAQALQARASRVAPSVHMNPVLLKPQSETGAQLIVQGRMMGAAGARDYQRRKAELMPAVLESFARVKRDAGIVLVEGAGSASEINLRANDIANMGFARAANVPVVLIGDIERGGVIASLIGTKAVIAPEDAALICGFLVNKMRGDASLFADGMAAIAAATGWKALGLVPHFAGASKLPAEDALGLAELVRARPAGAPAGAKIKIAVPVLPRISNFDDLDPLRLEPGVAVDMVERGRVLPVDADVVLLAGSKTTIDDLLSFRAEGWDIDIAAHVRRGGRVIGLCGGYQMLGRSIADPLGIEGPRRTVAGLGLLDVETVFGGDKTLKVVSGTFGGAEFTGYEIHLGATSGPDTARPMVRMSDGRADGATSADGRVSGCYIHGLFGAGAARRAWLAGLGAAPSGLDYEATIERTLDELAEHLARHIDIEALLKIAR